MVVRDSIEYWQLQKLWREIQKMTVVTPSVLLKVTTDGAIWGDPSGNS